MGIWQKAKETFQMIFGKSSIWTNFGVRTNKYTFKVGNSLESSVVMAPLLWFARNLPQSKIIVRDGNVINPDHDMALLLRRPNAYYGGTTLMMATVISLLYDGNSYWIKIRDSKYKPKELWYVPHWMIKPVGTEQEYVDHYEYSVNGKTYKLDPDDIVHLRYGLDLENPVKGMSPLKAVMREIFTDDESGNFVASLLVNQGIIGVIISPADNSAPIQDVQSVKEYIKKEYTGTRRGQPLVFSGPTKVEKLTFSPSEMDLGKLRNISEERISAILGVPAAVVGFGTGLQQTKVGATMRELRAMAWENGIIPLQRLMAESLEVELLTDYETDLRRYKVEFDNSAVKVLQEDEDKLYDRYNKGVMGGWLMVSEVRARLGWKIYKGQDIYLRPMNLIETPADTTEVSKGRKSRKSPNRDYVSNELHVALYRSYIQMVNQFEKGLKRRFEDYGKKVADIWLDVVKEKGLKLDPSDEIVIEIVIDRVMEKINKEDVLGYVPHYLNVAKVTIDTINSVMGLGLNLTDRVESAIIDIGGKRMGLVDLHEQTKEKLFKVISQAREDGKGAYEIADMIKDEIPAGRWSSADIRAKVISRTETKYAQNYSSLEAYKESPDVQMVQVVDGQLPTSDEFCISRDGEIVSFDEARDMMITEHPNGTLSFLPVVGGANED